MEWTTDVAAGDWIRARTDRPWRGTIHDVVPRGFAAYARVLHPASRDRPVGEPWPPEPWDEHRRAWEAFEKRAPEIDVEQVGWAEVARAFGTRLHPQAQWHALAGQTEPHPGVSPVDRDGWRYDEPMIGQLASSALTALAGILAAHTTDPDDGFTAVWEGWGGLVGGMGFGPARSLISVAMGEDAPRTRHGDFLAHTARDRFNDVFRKPTWQPGVLSDEISRGARLELPDRSYVLFRGGVSTFARPDWELRAPWCDRTPEEHGAPPMAESPSILWPADRSWIAVSEVDFDSTIVAGPRDLIAAVVADDRIEALQIPAEADLTSTGDRLNG